MGATDWEYMLASILLSFLLGLVGLLGIVWNEYHRYAIICWFV